VAKYSLSLIRYSGLGGVVASVFASTWVKKRYTSQFAMWLIKKTWAKGWFAAV
jgi:hypothetical protein